MVHLKKDSNSRQTSGVNYDRSHTMLTIVFLFYLNTCFYELLLIKLKKQMKSFCSLTLIFFAFKLIL